MAQSKSWSFTLFDHDEKTVDSLSGKASGVELLCFQEEKCPNSGRLHLQGFVRFSSNKRLGAVKTWLGDNGAHCEVAKGSPAQNLVYCSKDESATGEHRFQHGDFTKGGQGKRNDLDSVVDRIREGATLEDLNEEFPREIIKFGRGIQYSRSLFLSKQAPSTFPRTVIVLWGRSGSGKSLWARQYAQHHGLSIYSRNLTKASDTQWFDGYDGESILLLDDFTDAAVSFRELLIWTDIYKHRVQYKGSMSVGTWSHVIITSNVCPNLWYETLHGAQREPLVRRLDHVLEAPQAPHFCSDRYPVLRSYPGRSPPSLGAGSGSGDDGKDVHAPSGGNERRTIPPPPLSSQDSWTDPRDDPSFHFTDGLSSGSFVPDVPSGVRQLWDGASPPYYHESD